MSNVDLEWAYMLHLRALENLDRSIMQSATSQSSFTSRLLFGILPTTERVHRSQHVMPHLLALLSHHFLGTPLINGPDGGGPSAAVAPADASAMRMYG